MPISKYFNAYDEIEQQRLYKDLIEECISLFGIDCTYIPRTSLSEEDPLFGDDPTKSFTGGYPIAVFIQNVEGFEGPNDLFTKFGLTINKQLRILMGAEAFNKETDGDIGSRPREGDLIWLQNFKALFEIKFVNQDKFFYAFGSNPFYGYELVCEEFRYNNEQIDSGVEEVDYKVNEITIAYEAIMGAGELSFGADESVYQGITEATATATAIVLSWNAIDKVLVLKDIVGVFTPNNIVHGTRSGANYLLDSIEIQDNVNQTIDNNVLIRTEANTDLDLSESNPSGNPITF